MGSRDKNRYWGTGDPLMERYHDCEWGVPLHDDPKLFEFLTLEGTQSGLSWRLILNKRENFRRAFDGFDAGRVARYGERQIARLLSDAGIVRNRQAWALPQGDCFPGRHVISCGHKVLVDEEWNRDYFPCVHVQFQKPERSFYAKGMYHALAPLQREIDFTFQMISDAQRLCGAPKIIQHLRDSQDPVSVTTESGISNKIGEIIRVSGGESIEVYSPPALNSERFSYLTQLKQLSYEQVGVSQLSATSRLPIGIDGASGKALREYNDSETERAECQEMAEDGLVELGSHTHTHIDFRSRPVELMQDTQTSVDLLGKRFGLKEVSFAFPGGRRYSGHSGEKLMAAVKKLPVTCALTTDGAPLDWRTGPFGWGRFNVYPGRRLTPSDSGLGSPRPGGYFSLGQACLGACL